MAENIYSPLLLLNVKDGEAGQNSYVHIRYSNSPDGNPILGSGQVGKYIGIYYDSIEEDSNDYTKYKWSQLVGDNGENGKDGAPGATISSATVLYQLSDDGSNTPTGEWKPLSQITITKGKYLWTQTAISYSDGTNTTSYSVSYIATDGKNATTYYTWIRYADTPTSGMSSSPDGKEYIGIAYNKTTDIPSSNYNDYSWALIKGKDGIPGTNGTDGTTYYTWIKYADDINGAGISESPDGKYYIGIAYNKETSVESEIASDYTWSLFRGSDGIDGAPGRGISSTVINYAKNTSGTTPPTNNWYDSISDVGEVGDGEFLWVRTTINYTSGNSTISYSVERNTRQHFRNLRIHRTCNGIQSLRGIRSKGYGTYSRRSKRRLYRRQSDLYDRRGNQTRS